MFLGGFLWSLLTLAAFFLALNARGRIKILSERVRLAEDQIDRLNDDLRGSVMGRRLARPPGAPGNRGTARTETGSKAWRCRDAEARGTGNAEDADHSVADRRADRRRREGQRRRGASGRHHASDHRVNRRAHPPRAAASRNSSARGGPCGQEAPRSPSAASCWCAIRSKPASSARACAFCSARFWRPRSSPAANICGAGM